MNEHKTYPFVTMLEHNGLIYYGIVKIKSKQYITLYCFDSMIENLQEELLLLANNWWWQSNRTIPISLFMCDEMVKFEAFTKRFDTQTVRILSGPVISLADLPVKRIKRRNISLKKR